MRTRHRLPLVAALCAFGLLLACGNQVEVAPAANAAPKVGASEEVQRLVAEIDAMLAVPQDAYPDGNELSAVFEQLLEAVIRQRRTLRTNQVSQNMGYFIATGHGVGWDPREEDIVRLARAWNEFRPDVLAGP